MKKLLVILALFILAAPTLSQPTGVRIYSTPKLPPQDALDRLNLTLAWHKKLPVDSQRDGFYSLQLIPGRNFTLLVAQTLSGAVVAVNAETGDMLWRTSVGIPFPPMLPVAYNEQSIFVVRRSTLFALDRADGSQQIYTVDRDTNLKEFGFGLEFAPSAAPVADNDYLFICVNDRLVRYVVPNFRLALKIQAEAPPGSKLQGSPRPIRQWSFNTFANLSSTPALSMDSLALTTDSGTVYMIDKTNTKEDFAVMYAKFQAGGLVAATPAMNKSMVYVPCADYFLYALDVYGNRLLWRFAGGAPIMDSPIATDADVFVNVSKSGFYRLHRASGENKWSNHEAVRFLATNQRFVYALDTVGNMLILDYQRGKTMTAWDARPWVLSIANDLTDRIYLASHDGQVLCLRNRENVKPLAVKTFEAPKSKDGKKVEDEPLPKGDEKKKEEDKLPKTDEKKVDDKLPKDDDKKKADDKLPKDDDKKKADDKLPKDDDKKKADDKLPKDDDKKKVDDKLPKDDDKKKVDDKQPKDDDKKKADEKLQKDPDKKRAFAPDVSRRSTIHLAYEPVLRQQTLPKEAWQREQLLGRNLC